jgi:oligopeptide/dipeptide ABC transporter ATP-binding protein
MSEPLVKVEGLKKHFAVGRRIFKRTGNLLKAVDGINFEICKGETFALIGESGCGKTTTANLVLGLLTPTAGSIRYEGRDINKLRAAEFKEYRRSVQAIFQDPRGSLDPKMRVRDLLAEPLIVNNILPRGAAHGTVEEKVEAAIRRVGLPAESPTRYPHEFSGGQCQRIALARALMLNPKLVVLDEPVSALDVSISAQIMNLLQDLQEEFEMAYLLIAHNIATTRHMSNHVGIMYLGKILEMAPVEELFNHPFHPYTQALISASLPDHPDMQKEEIELPDEVPNPLTPPIGCHFHPRCHHVMPICREVEPEFKDITKGHKVACYLI